MPTENTPFGIPDNRQNFTENNTATYMSNAQAQWNIGTSTGTSGTPTATSIFGNAQLGAGIKAPMLDVATPLLFPPAIIVVLQVPAMYTADGVGSSEMAAALKDMFESHAKQVNGIDIQYSMDPVGQTPVGADGQQIVSPGKVTRAAVTPSFSFTEVSGNIYWNIIKKWMNDINNADTYAIGAGVNVQGGWTMSDYSMTFMAIQPDITHRPERIIDAAVYCNVFPTGTAELGMERTIGQIKHMDRTFSFQGIVQHNEFTKQLGRLVMSKLNIHSLDFNWAPPQRNTWTKSLNEFGLQPDINKRLGDYGISGIGNTGGISTAAKKSFDDSHQQSVGLAGSVAGGAPAGTV